MNKIIASLSAFALVAVTVIGPVNAAGVAVTDALSVTTASTASDHTITFTATSGIPADGTIKVTFPAGFVIGTVDFTDIDVTDDGTDVTLAATPSGATWGAAFSGQVLTLTNGSAAVAGGSVMIIELGLNATEGVAGDAQITNPVAGNYTVSVVTSAGDFGAVIVPVGNANQVTVSAVVEPVLTFSVAGGNVAFGSLNPVGDNLAGTQTTIAFTTNATTGIVINGSAVGGDTGPTAGALGIATTATVIPAIAAKTLVASLDDNAEYFAVALNTITDIVGNVTADAGFTTTVEGDSANDLSGTTVLVNSNSTPVQGSFKVEYHVGIIPTTDAGSYSGTVTYTAAPTF